MTSSESWGLEMSPPLCRGCAKQLAVENAGVDVFAEEASSSLRGNNVRTGIELITGIAVSHTDGLPRRLCTECNDKLEAFMAFRTQLLTSLRLFLSSRDSRAPTGTEHPLEMSLPALPVPILNQEGIGLSHVRENTYVTLESNSFVRYSSSQTEHYVKVKRANVTERDDESEIDVCSGDDDEVLELDFQSKKDEIYEIDSSEESDIQVCDYEPNRL